VSVYGNPDLGVSHLKIWVVVQAVGSLPDRDRKNEAILVGLKGEPLCKLPTFDGPSDIGRQFLGNFVVTEFSIFKGGHFLGWTKTSQQMFRNPKVSRIAQNCRLPTILYRSDPGRGIR